MEGGSSASTRTRIRVDWIGLDDAIWPTPAMSLANQNMICSDKALASKAKHKERDVSVR